ncbi:pyridoxamine 5'-phosphate oxidase family protein [Streptomyces sp. 4.24]|uniref:pyridoxamine 5'-phosphate oxidase family protein n=1 Tax=Streptomyces tritrimontium TaxID=3406573 RepID=UPI003BB50FE7
MSNAPDSPPAAPTGSYAPTDLTVPGRMREWASYDRNLVHAILDEAFVCHLGFVRDGRPVVLPTLYARVGEHLYLHGAVDSRPVRLAEAGGSRSDGEDSGLDVCVTVTHLDGLILGRSAFRHSVNYRSVVAHGRAHRVTDPEEKGRALRAIVEHVVPGRSADTRPPDARELDGVAVLRLDLSEVSAKSRVGGPNDEPGDAGLPHWSGQVPLIRGYGTPVPAADITPGVALPEYLGRLVRPAGPATA